MPERSDPALAGAAATEVADEFHRLVLGKSFSCIAGRAASMRGVLVISHYQRLADPASDREIYSDLERFALRRDEIHEHFASFVATFDSPFDVTEEVFEGLLWRQLQALHEIDRKLYQWAPGFDSDAMADHFAFSLAAQPFFVIGMHANSSRLARRFYRPALVFNSHIQFQRLRQDGRMGRIKKVVRSRELQLQGSLNPRLIDFGFRPESMRYSGRAVEPDWRCPFHAERADEAPKPATNGIADA